MATKKSNKKASATEAVDFLQAEVDRLTAEAKMDLAKKIEEARQRSMSRLQSTLNRSILEVNQELKKEQPGFFSRVGSFFKTVWQKTWDFLCRVGRGTKKLVVSFWEIGRNLLGAYWEFFKSFPFLTIAITAGITVPFALLFGFPQVAFWGAIAFSAVLTAGLVTALFNAGKAAIKDFRSKEVVTVAA